MKAQRAAAFLIVALASVLPAAADVVVKQKNSGKGLGGGVSGESTQYIKGARMRTDQTVGNSSISTIIDVNAQQLISLDHKKKEATVTDMAKIAAELATISASDVKASVTPTAQTRQVAGETCTVHDLNISVPMKMGNDQLSILMTGPVCLVKNGPGAADYATFYRAAAEKGLFFGDPRAARAQPGQAKGMTQAYREMAERGVPYSTEIQVKFEGSGMMAAMMNKMGGTSMTTEVTSIATEPVPDSTFEIPDGYKTKKQ